MRNVAGDMALSLLKYAEHLDGRDDPRPLGPEPSPFPSAKPHLTVQPVKAVVYSGLGTLWLASSEPELLPSDEVMRKIALDKTVSEFKMWASMSRKPGEPSDYMAVVLKQLADKLRAASLTSLRTEIRIEQIWHGVVDRLIQREYAYDAAFYGSTAELAEKIAYYYQRAAQGVSVYPNALATFKTVAKKGVVQGIHANGQQATPILVHRELVAQGKLTSLAEVFEPALSVWSYEIGVRKETEKGFAALRAGMTAKGLTPANTLYVGCDVERDIVPAKRQGFRTALLLADKGSANVTPAHLKDEKSKPNVLLTAFEQIASVVPNNGA
jgi:FMN phosphatase YigB (HAD superfamily)